MSTSISTIPLKIKFLTNFYGEDEKLSKITFSKNIIHSTEKEVKALTKTINDLPFICTNALYTEDFFDDLDITDIYKTIFDDEKLINYVNDKLSSERNGNPTGIEISNDNANCLCSSCKNTIIRSNVIITLRTLFPVSFPTINNVIDSLELVQKGEPGHFFGWDTQNRVIETLKGDIKYSYIQNNGEIYTFTRLIWLDDVLNHPDYSKVIKEYHVFYNWLLSKYTNKILNDYDLIIGDATNNIINFFLTLYEKLFMPFSGIPKNDETDEYVNSFKQKKFSDKFKKSFLSILYLNHITLRISVDTKISIDTFKKRITELFLNSNEQVKINPTILNNIINWINEYDGMIYYINDEKEDSDIDICNDKSFYATKNIDELKNIDYIKFCFNKTDIKGNNFAYSVDEIYNVVYDDEICRNYNRLANIKIFITHLKSLEETILEPKQSLSSLSQPRRVPPTNQNIDEQFNDEDDEDEDESYRTADADADEDNMSDITSVTGKTSETSVTGDNAAQLKKDQKKIVNEEGITDENIEQTNEKYTSLPEPPYTKTKIASSSFDKELLEELHEQKKNKTNELTILEKQITDLTKKLKAQKESIEVENKEKTNKGGGTSIVNTNPVQSLNPQLRSAPSTNQDNNDIDKLKSKQKQLNAEIEKLKQQLDKLESSEYKSDLNSLFSFDIENSIPNKIIKLTKQLDLELETAKQTINEQGKRTDISSESEYIRVRNAFNSFNPKQGDKGSSSNQLLSDLIDNQYLKEDYTLYCPHNTRVTIGPSCKYITDIFERIYKKFVSGEQITDGCNSIIPLVMNTGISIKIDPETSKKSATIYVMADFLKGEVTDENITEFKCKHYDQKLGLLIENNMSGDDPITSEWKVTGDRLLIEPPDEEDDEPENPLEEDILVQQQLPPPPIFNQPPNFNQPPQPPININNDPPRKEQSSINNIDAKFIDFIIHNKEIKLKLDDFNRQSREPIPETKLFEKIKETNPNLSNVINLWEKTSRNDTDDFKRTWQTSNINAIKDLEKSIAIEESKKNIPNIPPNELAIIEAKKRKYDLYLVIAKELSNDGSSNLGIQIDKVEDKSQKGGAKKRKTKSSKKNAKKNKTKKYYKRKI